MVKTPMKFIKKKWATFDYFVTPDKYTTNIMKMVGWKKSELIKSPYPRLDFYLDYPNEKIEEFKTKYGFEKVVFYAPSWIGNKGFTENEIYISLNKILKDLKEDEKLIVSNHNIREVKILYKYDSKYVGKVFINKVDFELEHNAFFKVSNKMITDFSSIVYDFAKLYGWEKIDFYNPIDDEENSINVRKTYEKQYGEYGQIYLLKNKKVFIDEKKRRKKIGSGYQKPKNMSNSEYLFKKIEKIILKNTK